MPSSKSYIALALSLSLFGTDAFAAEGRTVGQFAVSNLGSAQYSIPLWNPPGIRGVQPHLTLSYDSHFSYGLMGPGWALGGLSSISRCNPTFAQDGTPAPITLTTADGLCLDGHRLRSTGTGVYQTEIADFSNVTTSGTAGNGPSYFTVQREDGSIYEYGNTTDSKIFPSTGATPYIWALDKVTDRSGNQMIFTYSQAGGSYTPLSIQYTAPSGSTTFPYKISFAYTTKSANDTLTSIIAASQIQETQQLSTITVTSSGTTVRKYVLGYTPSTATLRATLTSIQECGGSAGTDCLSPTTIGYQNGTAGVANPTTSVGSGATNGTIYSVDINGDGKQDLVFAVSSGSNYQWWVQMASASGYGAPINTGAVTVGVTNFLLDDFDATGGNEILAPVGGTWYVYKLSPTSGTFTATSTGIAVVSNVFYASADADGDGRPDLIYADPTNKAMSVRLNTSLNGAFSFSSTPVVTSLGVVAVGLVGDNLLANSPIKRMDFDGDGRADLLLLLNGGHQSVVELLSRGTGPFVYGDNFVHDLNPFFVVKWNDDNCTDLIVGALVDISKCDGTASQLLTLPAIPTLILDWDGDGRTDAIANVGGTFQVYRSQGNNVATAVSTGIPFASGTYVVTDQDGDGLDDIVFSNSAAGYAIDFGLHNGADVHPDLATSFVDGYGLAANLTYHSIVNDNHINGDFCDGGGAPAAVFPYRYYCEPLQVVTAGVFTDPSNAGTSTYNQTYGLIGLWFNVQGRGLAGFSERLDFDSRNFLVHSSDNYSEQFPNTGMLTRHYATYAGPSAPPASYLVDTYYAPTWKYAPAGNNTVYVPYYSNIQRTDYDVGTGLPITTTSTNYTIDGYGNATNVAATVTDTDTNSPYYNDQWTTTTVNTITPNTTSWCLNLPTATTITKSSTAPGGAAITRTVNFVPDYTNCRQTQQVVEPSSTKYKVTTVYGYDGFGNLNSQAVTGVGMATRTTGLNWGTTGQFPAIVTNALSQQTQLAFDPNTGLQSSITDPNGITTSWSYDDFARKAKETRPDGTSTTWAYNSCAPACVNTNNRMTVVQTTTNTDNSTLTIQNSYLDLLDRVLVTSQLMANNSYDRNEIIYNSLGQVYQTVAPCLFSSCTKYYTTNTYDVIGRLVQTQRPNSAADSTVLTTAYAYDGRTSMVTDPQGKVSTTITQVTGSVGRSQDNNGYAINFSHDAFGAVLSVTDSLSNTLRTTSYTYGLQAYPQSSTDMDLGPRSYSIDALGEVTAYTDAKSQSFSMAYDALSRPTSRTEPDLTTTWTWGVTKASYNIGKLASVSSSATAGTYTDAYTYDSDGRPLTRTLTLPTVGAQAFNFYYNSTTGQLQNLKYPTSTSGYRLTANYVYTNGLLTAVRDQLVPSTVWWKANSYNARGQVTQETTTALSGDPAIVSQHVYDALTGRVATIQSGVGSGAALQNESYLYDYVGNVTERQNNNAGLTENFYYDNLYRLDHSKLGSNTNLQMGYDAMGNITSRSDIAAGAAWTYDPTHKHQVTQAGSSAYTYSYDGNGNAKTRNGSTQSWTSYNYPSYVGTSTESASFDYGPDRQRWRMIYTGPSGTETTYYATPFLEEVATSSGTDYRHYVYAGSKPVVVISRTTAGAVTVRSLLSDHQGSISSIVADSTGTSYVSESFTAYGNRRESSTWTGSPTSTERTTMDGVTREGYTFQTVLGSMGLNHMNGRIEDAVTGRFLSSDPYIPDLSNTQSYNRYSYVNNNPLTTVDPTGFDGCSEEVASNYIGCGAGDGSLLPPVVVTGSPPGSTTTTINPGGYAVTAPDGGLTLVGTAPAPAKPTVPPASTTVTANPQPLPFYPSVNPLNVQSNLSQSQKQPDPRCQKPLPGNSTVTKNVNFLRQLTYMSGGQGAPFVAWLLNVAPGGKWDYKQSGQPGSEMMGNFNFGATGSDFFSPTTLLSGAGIVQLLTLPSNSSGGIPFVLPPYGDESGDQIDIQAGIDAGC